MTGEDQLILLAEISIALAGFAGIVVTYQFRDTHKISRGNAVGLALIIHCGLVDGFFAVLPMAVFFLGVSEQSAFRFSSAMHCVNYALYYAWTIRNMRGVPVRNQGAKVYFLALYALGVGVFVINVLNALNIHFHGEFGPYFLACLLPLMIAGYMFARLVLRPLWRALREAETDAT
ncbi:MAG: hypothetical protein R3F50_12550 [Gammaproteobacteria bacterium]|jgi:hypothetical protein